MKRIQLFLLAVVCLCGPLLGQQRRAAKSPAQVTPEAAPETKSADPVAPGPRSSQAGPAADAEPRVKVVDYDEKDIVRVNTKLRYTTLIVLPKSERILDFTCGDKEFWVVNGTENFAYVKPAKAGAQTNLNLITASGNIYSFVLHEVSESREMAPDVKVFVESTNEAALQAPSAPPKFVSTQVIEDYKQQVEIAKEETRRVKDSAQAAIDKGISQFVSNVRFPYRFDAGKKPFFVRTMYTDDKFTYIQARPEETPTLYEIKDGQPNLVDFQYKNGVYVVEKILDQGYLAIGKEKLSFKKED